MSALARRVARRLGWAALVIAIVTTFSFVAIFALPGDPARMMLGPQASAADVAQARRIYGLDRPVYVQYARFVARLVHAGPRAIDPKRDKDHGTCASVALGVHVDLGYSFFYRRPVVDLLAARIPRSFELGVTALVMQLFVGLLLGVVAGAKRGSAWDEVAMGAALLGMSAPTFLVGLALRHVLAYRLKLLPFDGYGATSAEHLRSLVLPAATLGIYGAAIYARIARDEVAGALGSDHARTAKAKGAGPLRVLVVHALRNAFAPIATLAALDLGALLGGAVVTERLFRWPGVGMLVVDALLNRDASVVFGAVLFSSLAVVTSMLALDALLYVVDPRRRSA